MFFLVLEGMDGVGKSTQADLLAKHLRERRGGDVLLIQEPGGTRLGESLRSLVLDPSSGDLDATTEVFLFMAARSHLVRTRIRPALESGAAVVCDRFLWSSIVYQGIVGGLGIETVLDLGRLAVDGVQPTRTILLDMTVDDTVERTRRRGGADRFEERGREFQERVRQGFLELAGRFPAEITLVDAGGEVEEVQERIRSALPEI